MKFVILSPRQTGGGPIALHILCKELVKFGFDAKILYIQGRGHKKNQKRIKFFINWILFNIKDAFKYIVYLISKIITLEKKVIFRDYFYEPVKNCKRKWLPSVSDDTVVIYTEIFYGNILHAKQIVRWFLYFNKFSDDKNAYGENDLFFCYRNIFNDYRLNPDCKTLCLQNFDFMLYKQTNFKDREGCCYIVRKGKNRKDIPNKYNGPIIDKCNEEDKVKAFNKYRTCYFYDTQTFYTVVASVCGCIPIVVMEPGKNKNDYLGIGEMPLGVAYGDKKEEIEYAIRTRENCIKNLEWFDNENKLAVKSFVEICEEHFDI